MLITIQKSLLPALNDTTSFVAIHYIFFYTEHVTFIYMCVHAEKTNSSCRMLMLSKSILKFMVTHITFELVWVCFSSRKSAKVSSPLKNAQNKE